MKELITTFVLLIYFTAHSQNKSVCNMISSEAPVPKVFMPPNLSEPILEKDIFWIQKNNSNAGIRVSGNRFNGTLVNDSPPQG